MPPVGNDRGWGFQPQRCGWKPQPQRGNLQRAAAYHGKETMKDTDCVEFLQWALPRLSFRWPGFRKVRRQVGKRIQTRIDRLGLEDVGAYRTYLEREPREWALLDEFCRISISRFYRDRGVFDLLRATVLPQLAHDAAEQRRKEIRVWSAGCASGEEPYTLRVIWDLEIKPLFAGLQLQILATDASPHMLARAKAGRYPLSSFKDFPLEWHTKAFTVDGDLFRLRDEHRRCIDFLQQDIRVEQPAGPFDMIFCRHLAFTYFDDPLQKTVLGWLLNRLSPRGMLVTGKHEDLLKLSGDVAECYDNSGVYRFAASVS